MYSLFSIDLNKNFYDTIFIKISHFAVGIYIALDSSVVIRETKKIILLKFDYFCNWESKRLFCISLFKKDSTMWLYWKYFRKCTKLTFWIFCYSIVTFMNCLVCPYVWDISFSFPFVRRVQSLSSMKSTKDFSSHQLSRNSLLFIGKDLDFSTAFYLFRRFVFIFFLTHSKLFLNLSAGKFSTYPEIQSNSRFRSEARMFSISWHLRVQFHILIIFGVAVL